MEEKNTHEQKPVYRCSKCTAQIPRNARFCWYCGAQVSPNIPRPTEYPEPVQPVKTETVATPTTTVANAQNVAQSAVVSPAALPVQKVTQDTPAQENACREPVQATNESVFTGGTFANFFSLLLLVLGSIFTLFLAYPALMCWRMRWKTRHTYINGKRLTFDGNALQLYGKFLLWLLLCVITFGIYLALAMPLNLKRWQIEHTHFEGTEGEVGESKFDGSIWGLFGINAMRAFLIPITLGFGYFYVHCKEERWYATHTMIDGCRLQFDGTGRQFFGKCIVWVLLTLVTLGIYSFWLSIKILQWTTLHTHVENVNILPTIYPVDETPQKSVFPSRKPKESKSEIEQTTVQETTQVTTKETNANSSLPIFGFLLTALGIIISPAVSLIGFILCCVALKNSEKKTLASWGIVLGVFYLIVTLLFIFVVRPALG